MNARGEGMQFKHRADQSMLINQKSITRVKQVMAMMKLTNMTDSVIKENSKRNLIAIKARDLSWACSTRFGRGWSCKNLPPYFGDRQFWQTLDTQG